ncbi:putative membrane protein [Actinokineospora baliensis]|uniref:SdpI family protein n=1 Tax=Actinokineospora baliensis TaxID=547056 RepID=UPI00195A77D0|nr:SdpI family protein [Actinokineospora baliensis]MBM7771014.1 putative membrane protein [Actinokineospora baliensis]
MNLVPLAPLVAGLPLLVLGFLGLTERLPRNRFGGVRTPASLRSPEAFRTANKVAGLPTLVAGLVGVLGAAAGFALESTAAVLTVSVIAVIGLAVITLAAGVLGNRAAEAVPEPKPAVPAGCAGCQCGTCDVLTRS